MEWPNRARDTHRFLYPTRYPIPIPYTLYPIPYTLYPIPYTLYPIPYTLYTESGSYTLYLYLYPIPYKTMRTGLDNNRIISFYMPYTCTRPCTVSCGHYSNWDVAP